MADDDLLTALNSWIALESRRRVLAPNHPDYDEVKRYTREAATTLIQQALDIENIRIYGPCSHRYRIECKVCGQPGTIRVSVDPERTDT